MFVTNKNQHAFLLNLSQSWPLPLISWPWSNRVSPRTMNKPARDAWKWLSKICSLYQFQNVGWLVVLRIYVTLAVFQPCRDLETGDNQSLKFKWRGGESNPGPLAPQAKSLTTWPNAAPKFKNVKHYKHTRQTLTQPNMNGHITKTFLQNSKGTALSLQSTKCIGQ